MASCGNWQSQPHGAYNRFRTLASPSILFFSVHLLVMLVFWCYRNAHPRMNAALVSRHYFMFQWKRGTSAGWNEEVFITWWLGDEVAIDYCCAFRRRHGIA